MKNNLTHFAIYIDDMQRAKSFYSSLFGWGYNSYGQADFFQVKDSPESDGKLIGALQARKYSPIKEKVIGFECSIEVANIDVLAKTVVEKGGEIVMPKTAIPYVGWLLKFLDTEGNLVCAIQYSSTAK